MSRLLPGKHFSFELARKLPSRLMSVTTLPAEGKLKPSISHRFPLARTADALDAIVRREVVGKAIITVP